MPNFTSTRTFGIEIEFIGDREAAARAINAAGIGCNVQEYDHRTPTAWKIVTDASIGYENGELVSPILRGEEGLEQVRKVCSALRSIGHKVDKRCGVHVHVGVPELTGPEIANVFKRYLAGEDKIDAIMPRSRRGNGNRFCYSLTQYRARIETANSVRDLQNAFYSERHVKLNVMSYVRQKTIEFRHHSGSLSGEKVTNWIQFCVGFVEASRSTTATGNTSVTPRRRNTNSARARAVAAIGSAWNNRLFLRDSIYMYDDTFANNIGVSIDALAPLMSVLRREGYTIKRRRSLNAYEIIGVPATVVAAPTSVNTLPVATATFVSEAHANPFYGLSAEIVNYYEERAQDLANG